MSHSHLNRFAAKVGVVQVFNNLIHRDGLTHNIMVVTAVTVAAVVVGDDPNDRFDLFSLFHHLNIGNGTFPCNALTKQVHDAFF